MDNALRRARSQRQKRAWRVRKVLKGTAERPRLTVFRSNRHIHVQVVDDLQGVTLAAASTQQTAVQEQGARRKGVESGKLIGQVVARRCKELGLTTVIFDRGPARFHGIVAAVAEGVREEGVRV